MNRRELQIRQARAIRVADEPTLSVVVISEHSRTDLESCLEGMLPACTAHRAQLVVVRAAAPEEIRDLRRTYPTVRFAAAAPGTAVPDMRTIGMKAAEGDIVLFQPEAPVEGDWVPPRAFER